jgi:hypothetical protein
MFYDIHLYTLCYYICCLLDACMRCTWLCSLKSGVTVLCRYLLLAQPRRPLPRHARPRRPRLRHARPRRSYLRPARPRRSCQRHARPRRSCLRHARPVDPACATRGPVDPACTTRGPVDPACATCGPVDPGSLRQPCTHLPSPWPRHYLGAPRPGPVDERGPLGRVAWPPEGG